MQESLHFVFITLTTYALSVVLGTAVMGAVICSLGVKVREATFGVGPRLWQFSIKSIPITINWVMMSAYLKLCDNRFEELSGPHEISLQSVNPILRCAVLMSGVAAMFVPLLLIAPEEIGARALIAIPQIIQGALSPLGYAHELLARGQELAREAGYAFVIAIILAKLATFQLIPFAPNLGLGQAIASMFASKPSKTMALWGTITVLVYFAICCSWFVAIVTYPFL